MARARHYAAEYGFAAAAIDAPGCGDRPRSAVDEQFRADLRRAMDVSDRARTSRRGIPPSDDQITRLFTGWREELATCRKFAPAARNYTACRLMSEVGLRVNEACKLDLPDVKWDLGRFGKLHVRHGKGRPGVGAA
ncbi:MAG TPA: hypothetical protein VNW94_24630 [Streptosporangiaceae bacterium]|nr:hypothetical protein [Streptosporangiaceae bacterium]